MPPVGKRDVSIILYDVKTNPDFAKDAKKCLLNICASKWFLDSKDYTKLILLNTQETNNIIHDKFGKAPHICEKTDVICYNPKLIKPYIEDVETAGADWLMGLAVAIDAIKENYWNVKGYETVQLLFITDFSTSTQIKEKRIEFAITNLNSMNVYLYILGPKVKVPKFMSSYKDIEEWSKNIEFIDANVNQNLIVAKRIIENTRGIICDLELGQELFKTYKKSISLQQWKVPLTAGTSFAVPANTTRFLRPIGIPRFSIENKDGVKEPWKWHLVDDLMVEISSSDVIGGVLKHGKFISLPSDVEKDFKYNGSRGFKIIGFTSKSNIPELYMHGNGSSSVESTDSKNFELLLQLLAEQDKCIIAQRVYMQNCRPKLVALLPEPDYGIFILVDLPYMDSIKTNFLEDVPPTETLPEEPVVDAMYEYLHKLDISDPNNRDENGSVKVPLAANLMDSIRVKHIVRKCLNKYLEEDMDLSDDILWPQFDNIDSYKNFIPVQADRVAENN